MNNLQLSPLLEEYNSILIFTHVRPDGDAIGSTLAWQRALELAGKEVNIFCPDDIPLKYAFLPGSELFNKYIESCSKNHLVFVIDCSDLNRLEYMKNKISSAGRVVNVDHHTTNEYFGDYNIVDENASASAEIIYNLIKANELSLTFDISLALYVGIASDTGSFKYDNTTPRSMRIAGELLEKGVSPSLVSQKVFDQFPLSTIFLLRDALFSLKIDATRKIAWMSMSEKEVQKYEASSDELEGFVNYAKNIEGVEVGLFFYHTNEGSTKVGFRSKTVDISAAARSLGGGGHPRAAGCSVRGEPGEIENMVLDCVRKLLSKEENLQNCLYS